MKRPAMVRNNAARTGAIVLATAAAAYAADTGRSDLVNRELLRVCSDPANMPFSNQDEQGFENKIAHLIADELKTPVEYTWFPQVTGFIRQTLNAKRCDVVMGSVQSDDIVLNTNPYYRSTFVLVHAGSSGFEGLKSLSDGRLKGKKLGVIAGTPPANLFVQHGLVADAKSYPLVVDRRFESPAERMIEDIRKGEIDAGVLWGPIGGYFATRGDGEKLQAKPLTGDIRGPFMAYRITLGVRHLEENWKRQLNEIIARRQGDIDAILLSYDVPLLDEQAGAITSPRR